MSPVKRTGEETGRLRTSLLEHALRIVNRDGTAALTMRVLATEAQCSVGLPYKVFASREDLIAQLVRKELDRVLDGFSRLIEGAGEGTVGGNLGQYAELLLGSPAISLGAEIAHDADASKAVEDKAEESHFGDALGATVARYLAAEKKLGRLRDDVDENAFGFLIAGAVHSLIVSPPGYPHPTIAQLKKMLTAIVRSLTP